MFTFEIKTTKTSSWLPVALDIGRQSGSTTFESRINAAAAAFTYCYNRGLDDWRVVEA